MRLGSRRKACAFWRVMKWVTFKEPEKFKRRRKWRKVFSFFLCRLRNSGITKQKEIRIYDLWFFIFFPSFSQQPNCAFMLSTVSISVSRSETYDQWQSQWQGTLGNESQTLKSYESYTAWVMYFYVANRYLLNCALALMVFRWEISDISDYRKKISSQC